MPTYGMRVRDSNNKIVLQADSRSLFILERASFGPIAASGGTSTKNYSYRVASVIPVDGWLLSGGVPYALTLTISISGNTSSVTVTNNTTTVQNPEGMVISGG